jgi:hypothetical protein
LDRGREDQLVVPEAAIVFRRSSPIAHDSEGKIKIVGPNHAEGGQAAGSTSKED